MTSNAFKILGMLGVLGAVALGATAPAAAQVVYFGTGPGWHHHYDHGPYAWGIPNNRYSRYPYWGRRCY